MAEIVGSQRCDCRRRTGVREARHRRGHQDFGIYATITTGGSVAAGDRLEVL